ncbi:hypothetical protein [uncultured Clostridium sp.]|nr:hypothetical protein [uncultured Clostridium sp.]
MLGVIIIILIYGAGILAAIGLLIYTIAKRMDEKKREEKEHKKYDDY